MSSWSLRSDVRLGVRGEDGGRWRADEGLWGGEEGGEGGAGGGVGGGVAEVECIAVLVLLGAPSPVQADAVVTDLALALAVEASWFLLSTESMSAWVYTTTIAFTTE